MTVGDWAKCCSMRMEVKLACVLVNVRRTCTFIGYPKQISQKIMENDERHIRNHNKLMLLQF